MTDDRAKVYDDSRAKGMTHEQAVAAAEAHHKTQLAIEAKPPVDDFKESLTPVEKIGAGAQAFSDAATLGASGLIDDAFLSSGSFKENRALRSQSKDALHPSVRFGTELAGALASPVGSAWTAAKALQAARTARAARAAVNLVRPGSSLVPQAARNASWTARTGRVVGDAAAQSGIAGTIGNLDEASGEGVLHAANQGWKNALMGGAVGGTLGAVAGAGSRVLSRTRNLPKLDKAAFKIQDEMAALDAANYGAAAGEATSTQPIREVLESKTVKPFADIIRGSEKFQNADDATVLMESYKLMSQAARRAENAIEGTAEHQARQMLQKEDIGLAKGRMLDAAEKPSTIVGPPKLMPVEQPFNIHPEIARGFPKHTAEMRASQQPKFVEVGPPDVTEVGPGIPSLREAIRSHRTKAGELEALTEGADIGKSVGSGKSLPGKKLLLSSQEAFMRKIPDMTVPEAEAALAGIMGRTGEAVHMTASPLGKFGLVSSVFRLPAQMYRTGPIIQALESKLGRSTTGQPLADITRGTIARMLGGYRP